MKIHEYQSKDLLRQFGIAVPHSIAVFSAQEALEAAQKLGGTRWMVKAQIHAGGRGKGGGVVLAYSPQEVQEIASRMLGANLVTHQTGPSGKKVRRILIEEAVDIQCEYYVSVLFDRTSQKVVILACSDGGMEIEEVAKTHPEKIIKVEIDPLVGIMTQQCLMLMKGLGVATAFEGEFLQLFIRLYTFFMETDATLVELNPLIIEKNGSVIALDAKLDIDNNALFRHPEIVALRDMDEENPAELEAAAYDLSYISLDGNIGCMVNGAGLAMATMDIIKLYGGEPANFLDVGGGASEEKVMAAFEIMLKKPKVKALLVNIFGGIMRCDVIANGIVAASRKIKLTIPLVVRMKGAYEEEGRQVLEASGLPIISAQTMAEAAQMAVDAARRG